VINLKAARAMGLDSFVVAERLDAGVEARADEDASGTERECRGKPAPVGNAAGQPAARMS
jgi:hypothetical protein